MRMSAMAVRTSCGVVPSRKRAIASRMTHPLEDRERVAHALDVVHAHQVRAGGDGGQAGADGRVVAIVDRAAGQLPEEALARRADHDRPGEARAELAGARQELEVLRQLLAE